jgi:hypothetical protein
MSRLFTVIVILGLAAAAGSFLLTIPPDEPEEGSWFAAERERLEFALRRAEPGSPRAFKLRTKIARLDARRGGAPQPGFPDEFNRMLYDRKVPSDRSAPEYAPGYRFRELARAPRSAKTEPLDWRNRGPGNVAGRARGLIVDPEDPTGLTWFIASVGGGIWWTGDGGVNWTELTDELPVVAIQCLAMAPSNHDVIYAGTGESFYNIDTLHGNGMLKSVDRGATWTPLPATLDDPRFQNVSRIIVSPSDPDLVVASTTTGRYLDHVNGTSSIFRSTDGGVTWSEVHTESGVTYPGGDRILQVIADPTDFSVQYATVYDKGILKSEDAGLSWSYVNNGITDFYGRFEMAISPVDPKYLYAASQGSAHSELWVSWDGGGEWHETFEDGDEPVWLGGQGWYDNAIVCHPTDPSIVYVGGLELWRIDLDSVGAGSTQRTTTRLASYSFPHPDHHVLEIVQDGGGWWLLGTNDGGVTRTTAGDAGFVSPIDGMVTTQFYGVDKRPGASAYIGGMQDNGTWRSPIDPDAGTPWTYEIGGDGYETSWHFDDPLKILGGYQFNGLMRSLDGGETWESGQDGLADVGGGAAPFVTKIGKSTARPDHVFAVGASGVWRSTDFGDNWSLSTVVTGTLGDLHSFMDVRVSAADPDVVWAGVRMGVDGDILVSTDGGLTFNAATDYPDATLGLISGLATDPHDSQTAYVLFSFAERPKVLRTTDLGATWTDISGFGSGSVSTNGFPDVAVYDLMVFPNDPDRIWVGSEIGLIESGDGGASWGLAENGLPAVGIWKLSAVEDEIILATHGRGIWTVTDPALMAGATYKPLFERAVQQPTGDLHLEFNLRSAYDSTQVRIDGAVAAVYGPNAPLQTETLDVPVLSTHTSTVFARSYLDGDTYDSVTRSVDVVALLEAGTDYANDVNAAIDVDDFLCDGFGYDLPSAFNDGALHTTHDYAPDANYTAMLIKPIVLAETTTLSFDEVVIVEIGAPGSVYGGWDFYDYVVVEGTSDGIHWLPVADGYDSREHADWEFYEQIAEDGNANLYHQRVINLNDTFARGETILLRWRLYSDAYVERWGWAVDDVEIVSEGSTAAEDLPAAFALAPNRPNPFNAATTISFDLPRPDRIRLEILDLRGRRVRILARGPHAAGPHSVVWDGRDERGEAAASGTYVYRLQTSERVLSRKMSLVK